jgi:anti-sigma regulatory factor (Ser/Thr protein kinase)
MNSQLTQTTLRLPFAASSVSVARLELQHWMSDTGAPQESVEDARVVVSELVANSVRHAGPLPDGTIQVSWGRSRGGVDVAVTDGGGATRARTVHTPATALAGRGMAIVEALAHEWWTEVGPSRSTVHALLKI